MHISKIIIPAAGIGSRFLPITKSVPKEMLPLANKPAIEYIVQEAVDAQLSDIIMVLSPTKMMIKDYFSSDPSLEKILQQQNKSQYLEPLQNLINRTHFQYFIQQQPLGLAHALLQAREAIAQDEFFAVALPDDIMMRSTSLEPEIGYLMRKAQQLGGMVIAVQEVAQEMVSSYGIVSIKKQIDTQSFEIASLVEKPSIDRAPSRMAIVGRYIFHQSLFDWIVKTTPTQGEILLPNTINLMIQQGIPVYAVLIQGRRFDIGTPQGWLDCIVQTML